MPGWCVVLKKEARGRRIHCMELEYGLGQEGSRDDLEVLTSMDAGRSPQRDDIGGDEVLVRHTNRHRRSRDDNL